MEWLFDPTAWLGLLTLILLELILGIDNLVFIAILAQKLPASQRDKARKLGLFLALGIRLLLLTSIAYLTTMTAPLIDIGGQVFSGRDLIMLGGGLFLLYKATTEVHARLEGKNHGGGGSGYKAKFWMVIAQILILDAVFSIDSVVTAVGMSDHLPIMMLAVIISIALMILVSRPLTEFVNRHQTIVMLCLGFLLMVGFSLVAEGFGFHIPKGYLYAAIGFSILIEAANQFAQAKLKKRVTEKPYVRERTADAVLKLLGARKTGGEDNAEEIGMLLRQAGNEDILTSSEKDLLRGVLNLAERPVSTIMTPRTDIEWLDVSEADDGIRQQLIETGYSQLLVGEGSLENILGAVQKEDFLTPLLRDNKIPPLKNIMSEPLFIHETITIQTLLESFKKKHAQMAVVIDEFGSVQGLVTHHDLLEAIAGQFPDHDDPKPENDILLQQDGSYIIEGMASIYDVRDRIGFDYMPDGEFATMAGFILHEMGKFPVAGEILPWEGWNIEILSLEGKRIGKVKMSRMATDHTG